MEDESLDGWATGVAVHFLFIGFRAERGQDQRHRLAATEQTGAVRTGQQADFCCELTQIFCATTIGPFIIQNRTPNRIVFNSVK